MMNNKCISVVAPFFNEAGNVARLHGELVSVLRALNLPFEIIFVDDGSNDGTFDIMKKLSPLIAVRLKRNCGQSAALDTGIKKSRGDIIVTIDGDLENDPKDIPLLLKELKDGRNIVSGCYQLK